MLVTNDLLLYLIEMLFHYLLEVVEVVGLVGLVGLSRLLFNLFLALIITICVYP